MFRGAITSRAERDALASIENVHRLGRVNYLSTNKIGLVDGELPTDPKQVHVDCTAYGFASSPLRPIFEPGRIVIQSLIGGHTTYNAALLGYIESTTRDEEEKNRLCPPCAQCDTPLDWIRMMVGIVRTSAMHSEEADIAAWQNGARLNLSNGVEQFAEEPRMKAALERWHGHAEQALENAATLLA